MFRRFARIGSLIAAAMWAVTPGTAQVVDTGQAPPADTGKTILVGNLIADAASGTSGPATITVRDGRIVSVEKGLNRPPSEANGGDVIDLSDRTVLPGLIDTHVHLTGDPGGDFWKEAVEPDEWGVVVGAKNARVTVKAGFTTVRDVGSAQETAFVLRRGTAEGLIPGPRIIASGPALAIIGGHADVSGFRPEVNDLLSSGFTCTGETECAAKVRQASKNGSDLIKITATGGVLSQQARGLDQHFTDAEMRSIAVTAHALGMKVAAHAHGPRGIEAAANAGIDSIEHCTFADAASIKAMKANGTVCVPTLLAFVGVKEGLGKGVYTPPVEDKIRMTLESLGKAPTAMRKAGIPVVFGTDSGVTAHGRNAEEFALMAQYIGMSPREALASATTEAAKLIDLENEVGRIAPGYSADLIAVEGDPLADLTTLQNVTWVMARGRVVE